MMDVYWRRSYVYFIQAPAVGLIKIGRSCNRPAHRLSILRSASPVLLVPLGIIRGSLDYEHRLHRTFAAFREHGEWFRPEPRLLRFIARWTHPWESLSKLEPHVELPIDLTRETIWERAWANRNRRDPLSVLAPKAPRSMPG